MRAVVVACAIAVCGQAHAQAPDASRAAAIADTLTPAVASVLLPMPPIHGTSREDKLRFMAELGWRLDAREHYSDMPAWRAIMGWPEPFDTIFTWSRAADDQSPTRYPVPEGKDDPALDFAASLAVGWIDPRTLSCRFPLRARFLLAHGLMRGPLALDEGRCPIDRWADWSRVDGVEVMYVTPNLDDPSASMGHVLFRVRHEAKERVTGESFAPTFAYSAIDDPKTTPNYLLRGMSGGLTASMKLERFGDVYRRYAIDEGRDLVLYDLVLSRTELHDLLAEAWMQKSDRMAVPYRFFSVNCASLAYDLVRSVLPELPRRSSFLTHPHEVVSRLIEARRLVPRGIIRSQRARAVVAERRAEALEPELDDLPGFRALYATRWSTPADRAEALHAFAARRPAGMADARGADVVDALTEYVDRVIDLETYALVLRDGAFNPGASSTALDEALALRATLPTTRDARIDPFPPHRIGPSGSRETQVTIGISAEARLQLALSLAVLDESAGEARAAVLRRTGRNVILRSETRFSSDGESAPVLDSERLTLFEMASWGIGLRTDRGWLASRLGFQVMIGSESWPRESMPFAIMLRGGPGLTLAASDDFTAHLVLGVDLALESWANASALFRGGVGLFAEAALPLGSIENRWRTIARVRPVWAYDDGFGLGVEIDTGFDLTLDPDAGLLLRPSLSWRAGFPAGDGLRFTLGLAW